MVAHYIRTILVFVFGLFLAYGIMGQSKVEQPGTPPEVVNLDKPVVTRIDPGTLPKPFETKSAFRNSKKVPQAVGAKLYMPKGFKINVFAEGDFREPRW